jgi:hypothetical protein
VILEYTVKGIRQMQKDLQADTKEKKKALETAIKVEGMRQLKLLREQIRQGEPGAEPYTAELSRIAARTKAGRLRKNQAPLYMLARLLRYFVTYENGDISFRFGFVGNKGGVGSSWKKLIQKHQASSDFDLHDTLYSGSRSELGRILARVGGRLKKKGDPDAKFFFLRSKTRRAKLPKRPMIAPFWERYKDEAEANIMDNWGRKLRGERI